MNKQKGFPKSLFKKAIALWFICILLYAVLQYTIEKYPSWSGEGTLISDILIWGGGLGIPVILIFMVILQKLQDQGN